MVGFEALCYLILIFRVSDRLSCYAMNLAMLSQ